MPERNSATPPQHPVAPGVVGDATPGTPYGGFPPDVSSGTPPPAITPLLDEMITLPSHEDLVALAEQMERSSLRRIAAMLEAADDWLGRP